MSNYLHIVPFKLNDLYGGFAKAYGLIKIEQKMLVIEIETQDTITGMIKSGVKRYEFPIESINFLKLKNSLFSGKLIIGFLNMALLEQFPHRKADRIELLISRKNLDSALSLTSHLNYLITEYRLDSLDSFDKEYGVK